MLQMNCDIYLQKNTMIYRSRNCGLAVEEPKMKFKSLMKDLNSNNTNTKFIVITKNLQ